MSRPRPSPRPLLLSALLLLLLASCLGPSASEEDPDTSSKTHQHQRQTSQSQLPQSPPHSPACVGAGGLPVDWWVLLKYPEGQRAVYLDNSSVVRRASELRQQQQQREGWEPGPCGDAGALDEQDHKNPVSSEPPCSQSGCSWRLGLDVNDPKGPLRASLAPAADAAAAAAPPPARGAAAAAPAPGPASTSARPADRLLKPLLLRPWGYLARAWRALVSPSAPATTSTATTSTATTSTATTSTATTSTATTSTATTSTPTSDVIAGVSRPTRMTPNPNPNPNPDPDSSKAGAGASPLGYVFYNDADPEGDEHFGFAHAKGLLLFGPSGGIWITHSFPSYPAHPPRGNDSNLLGSARGGGGSGGGDDRGGEGLSVAENSSMRGDAGGSSSAGGNPGVGGGAGTEEVAWDMVRRAQTVYGQHALCLTLPAESIRAAAEGLLVARAYVYDYVLPPDLAEQYDTIQDLIDASSKEEEDEQERARRGEQGTATGKAPSPRSPPSRVPPPRAPPPPTNRNTSRQFLVTRGRTIWQYVTKSPHYTVPFHEQVLEPLLSAGMAWETWRLGTISYPSECPPETQYGSYNVRRITVPRCNACNTTNGPDPSGDSFAGSNGCDDAVRSSSGSSSRRFLGVPHSVNPGCGQVTSSTGGSSMVVEVGRRETASTSGVTGTGAAADGWDSLKDHSKWGISTAGISGAGDRTETGRQGAVIGAPPNTTPPPPAPPSPPPAQWVCLGDLNRQPSQRFRGGGYVCRRDPGLWAAFRGLVAEVEPCQRGRTT